LAGGEIYTRLYDDPSGGHHLHTNTRKVIIMNDAAENTEVETTETEVPKADILRGRMPVAMVYAIRFLEDGSDSELAKKYRTTNGKISDIKKNRNFGYITEGVKFSQEELDKALERAADLGEYADDVKGVIEGMEVGSEADVAAFDEQRKSTRKPRGKKAETATSDDTVTSDDGDDESEEEEVNIDDLID